MSDAHEAAVELAHSKEYQEYLKEYARKMRRLHRESSGLNMEEPE